MEKLDSLFSVIILNKYRFGLFCILTLLAARLFKGLSFIEKVICSAFYVYTLD